MAWSPCKVPMKSRRWQRYGSHLRRREGIAPRLIALPRIHAQMLERETSREKLLASRMRELALQQRMKSARPPAPGSASGARSGNAADDDEVRLTFSP
jgi:hypothetical protein